MKQFLPLPWSTDDHLTGLFVALILWWLMIPPEKSILLCWSFLGLEEKERITCNLPLIERIVSFLCCWNTTEYDKNNNYKQISHILIQNKFRHFRKNIISQNPFFPHPAPIKVDSYPPVPPPPLQHTDTHINSRLGYALVLQILFNQSSGAQQINSLITR